MDTFIAILVVLFLGFFALAAFGMTVGKKDMEYYEYLSEYVSRCGGSEWERKLVAEEYYRLLDGGRIPPELMEELRVKIIKKFK